MNESFDLILSFAVFEHLAMPWIVAEEIQKVLKVGGIVVIETHFSFSEHELPWHFFQFNANALEVLFSKELGFQILDSGLDTPMVGRFSSMAAPYLQRMTIRDLYCHSSVIALKVKEACMDLGEPFDWRRCITRINSETMYPVENGR